MAFGHVGALGGNSSKTSSTTVVITTSAVAEVGNVIVVVTAWDNTDVSDLDSTRLSCADSAGNTYTKVRERTNSPSATAADGSTCAIFICTVTAQLASGGTITVTSDTARTAKAASAREFTKGSGTLTVETQDFNEFNAADPTALTLSSLPSREYLFIGACAYENVNTDTISEASGNFTEWGQQGTTGGGVASNMCVEGAHRILTGTTETVDFDTSVDAGNGLVLFAALYEVVTASNGGVAFPTIWTIPNLARFRRPQNVFGESAIGAILIEDSDTGVGTEDFVLTAVLVDSDTGVGVDSATLIVALSDSDSGTDSENGSVVSSFTDTDTGVGVDDSTLTALLIDTDVGTDTEDASVNIFTLYSSHTLVPIIFKVSKLSLFRIARLVIAEELLAFVPVFASDTGVGSDTATLTVSLSDADTGIGTETGTLVSVYTDADTGVGSETSTLTAVITDVDSGTDTENATVDIPGTLVVTGLIPIIFKIGKLSRFRIAQRTIAEGQLPSVPVSDSDTGVGSENSILTTAITGTDTGVGSESSDRVIVSADIGSGAETATVRVIFTFDDVGTGTDAISINKIVTDAGVGIDFGSAFEQNISPIGTDFGIGIDIAFIFPLDVDFSNSRLVGTGGRSIAETTRGRGVLVGAGKVMSKLKSST